MEAKALLQTTPSYAHRPIRLVLVRANGPLFYSLACASLLEAGVPLAADRLLHFFGADRTLAQWISGEWLPRKLARASALRAYVEGTWPEYDGVGAHEQYHAAAEAEGGTAPHRPTGTHEALARCVATAQCGVLYRSLARWAEDPRLRELARAIAQEEAISFGQFRTLYDRRLRVQGLGFAGAWMTTLRCVRAARDSQVTRAFNAVNAHCAAHAPFPILEYREFITRMASVVERHGDLGKPERMLFRTWKARPHLRVEQTQQRAPAWFTPVLRAAA